MTIFSPNILDIRAQDVQIDPATRRPMVISSEGKRGVVMVYADWCPYCRMFKPIFEEFANTQKLDSDVVLGVIRSDESPAIFDEGEIPGFPCFKRMQDGRIERAEASIDRSSREAAFQSLRKILDMERDATVDDLETRVIRLQTNCGDSQEMRELRAQLAKTLAMQTMYLLQIRNLQREVASCEMHRSTGAAAAVPTRSLLSSKSAAKAKRSKTKTKLTTKTHSPSKNRSASSTSRRRTSKSRVGSKVRSSPVE